MKVLAFGAHPDDIEIGCGGTIAGLVAKGFEVHHALLTSGDAGSQSISRNDLAEIREREASASAEILGSHSVHFLREPDGLTTFRRETKIRIITLVRTVRPTLLFVHGPSDQFPDHKLCHQLVMDALLGAKGPWYQECQLPAHQPGLVLGYEVWNPIAKPQLLVPIDIEPKLRALRKHESQLAGIRYDDAFEGLARYRGSLSGTARFAEAFEILALQPSVDLHHYFT